DRGELLLDLGHQLRRQCVARLRAIEDESSDRAGALDAHLAGPGGSGGRHREASPAAPLNAATALSSSSYTSNSGSAWVKDRMRCTLPPTLRILSSPPISRVTRSPATSSP